ncbi:MAG: glycosyltransferase family 9 protein [Aestuariibacter sp.]
MTDIKNILVIRMLGLGDVTNIGIPAVRYCKQKYPDADITVLTYAAGKDILALAEPDLRFIHMPQGQWPDDLLKAMEAFLMLAEKVIAGEFDKIINLDTWFMPCFLARFLKDAGEPVEGNWISISIEDLLGQFQAQTLQHDYVHDPAAYIESSYFSMERWHTPWWQYGSVPDFGYPEFYLRRCCGFSDIDMDLTINVEPNPSLAKIRNKQKVIALACDARTKERNYPHGKQLQKLLEKAGYHVWTGFDGSMPMRKTLSKLKASDLLITVPSAPQWLATTVGCPSLVIVGDVDPRTLMPDYATEMSSEPVSPQLLVESIDSIFSESEN